MADKEPVEARQQAPNEQQSEVTNVPEGIDLSLYDIDVSEPFGFGTGFDDPKHPSIIYDKETGYAINNNPIDENFGDARVRDLQILMINELDSKGRTDQPSEILPKFGVDGIWRCETQAAFNRLLDEKGVQNKTVGGNTDSKCPGLEQFLLTEETLEELKGKPSEEKDGPTEKEVKKQKEEVVNVNDQCILISNLEQIVKDSKPPTHSPAFYDGSGELDNRGQIKYKNIHKVTASDSATMLNKLRMRKGILQFLSIRHWQLSQLVPMIKIYKQYPQGRGKPPREVEIKFNSFVDPITDLQDMLNSREQRGVGVGIEYLSYSLFGSNPDTAKRQVSGKLAIYAQNFNELFKTRRGFDQDGIEFEGGYRIIDLVLQSLGQAGRIGDPMNYTLKIVVGWGATGGGGILEPVLVNALKDTQLTMNLSVADYDIEILDDQGGGGGVRVVLDLHPRLEAVSLTNDSDVLADEETRNARRNRKKVFENLIRGEKVSDPSKANGGQSNCLTPKEIKTLKSIYDADIARDIENSQGSLLRQLLISGLVYSAAVTQKTDDEIEQEMLEIAEGDTELLEDQDRLRNELAKRPKVEVISDYCQDQRYQPENSVNKDPETRIIQYFFLGDLLAVALNNVLDSKDNEVYFGNVRFITGPLTIRDPDGVSDITINISDIPISVDLFSDFMASRVPRRIESGTTYPLYLFTREVIKKLVFEAMGPECFLGTNRQNVVLETDIITADSAAGGEDPIELKYNLGDIKGQRKKDKKSKSRSQNQETNSTKSSSVLDLDQFRIDFDNPENSTFVFDSFNQKSLRDKFTYLVIYAKTNKPISLQRPQPPLTRFRRDFENGIFHLTSGLDRGLLKSVSFSKNGNASKLLKSARIQENRDLPDLQLANNFQITADMYGNNIFFPGTYVYLNNRGLGADLLGEPDVRGTPANILGIGGYHLIGRVDNMINISGFSTKLTATFSSSGTEKAESFVSNVTPPELVNVECNDKSFGQAEKELKAALINNSSGGGSE